MHAKLLQLYLTLCNPVDYSQLTRLLCSWGFSRQEYWSGLPCLPPGNLPNPGIELMSLIFPALSGEFFNTSINWEAQFGLQFISFKHYFNIVV